MTQDFQHILQDNICLKKALHTTRHQNDKLQQELNELRFNYQQLLDKNTALNHTYNQFQKRNQLQTAQHNKDITTLTSQIEELKVLIQQKHQQLEAFQIKIIPNLDQDMIRVKLITEMQGPYQEAIEKKDREILRLKEKLAEIQRKYNVTQLKLQTKEKELKRQLEQTKQFYQNENSKLLKQLNNALNKKEIKTYDKQLFRNQRKQLDELRITIDLQSRNQLDLKKELMNAKVQKEKLLIQISQINQKKAMELHLTSQNAELRSIKQEKKRLEDQLTRKNQENQRLQKKFKNFERQYKVNEDQLKRNNHKTQQKWQMEKQALKEQVRKLKDQNRKLQGLKQRTEEQNQILLQKLKSSQKENQAKNEQLNKLKTVVSDLQRNIREFELARKKKLSLSKDLIEQAEQIKPKKREENTAKKQNNQRANNIKNQDKEYITQLQKVNSKLKQKLQIANKKIVELLKQKANLPKFGSDQADINQSISRDRTFSNIEIKNTKSHKQDNKGLLLQFRDASFIPLVPPTLYTHQRK